MKRRSIAALSGLFLLISLLSVGLGASSIAGEKVYYDGRITVIAKGKDGGGNIFDESTTITGFKIEHWNVVAGMFWQGDSFSCTANMEVNDINSEGVTIAKFGPEEFRFTAKEGGSVPDVASLMIQKTAKGYKYSVQVCPPVPPGGNTGPPFRSPRGWAGLGETLGDDFLPLEISGKVTNSDDGVTTTMTWVLNRHIK